MILRNRFISFLLAGILCFTAILSGLPMQVFAEQNTQDTSSVQKVTVECENVQSGDTSFPVSVRTTESALSAGAFLKSSANTAPVDSTAGYQVTFRVSMPEENDYIMEFVGSPIDWSWSSSYDISINGGSFIRLTTDNAEFIKNVDTTGFGTGNASAFRQYRMKNSIHLAAGENTITFRVTVPRASDNTKFIFYLDYLSFAAAPAPTPTPTDERYLFEVNPVEGENYFDTNFPEASCRTSDSLLSNGAGLTAGTRTAPASSEGYYFTYKVNIPQDGKYIINFVGSPMDWPYSSSYSIQINDGESTVLDSTNTTFIKNVDTEKFGTDTKSAFRKYSYKPSYFKQGENTITFRFKNGRQSDGKYIFYLDRFSVNPLKFSVEGEAYDAVNFTTEAHSTDPALSGGDFLMLDTQDEAPSGGYTATYKVFAPAAGRYSFDIISTRFSSPYASPYSIRVNNGEYTDITGSNASSSRYVDTKVYPRDEFQIIETRPVFELVAGVNTVSFRVNSRTVNSSRYRFYLDGFSVNYFQGISFTLTSEVPLNIFTTEDTGKAVDINVGDAVSEDLNISYSLKNYWSENVTGGSITIEAGHNSKQLELGTLPIGHYRLEVTAERNSVTFADEMAFSVVKSLGERNITADSPFAVDYGSYMLVPASRLDDYARALKLAGINWVRDRYKMSVTNPAEGVSDYSAFEPFVNALNRAGIKSLQLFYDTPERYRSNGNKLPDPDKLLSVYVYGKDAAEHFGNRVPAWEVWNEPDIQFTSASDSADKIAAYIKAISIGFRDSGANPLVSMSSFAYPPANYSELLMQNQISPYIDIYNFHAHRNESGAETMDIPAAIAQNVDFAQKYDVANKKIWASEIGVYQPLAQDAFDPSFAQQKKQARYMVEGAVSSLAKGVDKFFFFCFPYYIELGRSMGVFSSNNTPYAGYNAQAVLTDRLGDAVYAGSVRGLPGTVNAYVFKNGSKSVTVLWSENSTQVTVHAGKEQAVLTDIMGGQQMLAQASGSYTLTVGPDPVYFEIEGDFPAASLDAARPFEKEAPQQELTDAERIVIAQEYTTQSAITAKADGYMLKRGNNEIKVYVYNFNDKEMTGTINGQVPGNGWRLEQASQEVTIAARSMKTLTFVLSDTAGTKANITSSVKFEGVFDGKKTTSSVAMINLDEFQPVVMDRAFPNFNAGVLNAENAPTGGTHPFGDVISEGSTFTITDEITPDETATPAVKFKYNFGSGDRWAYPFLTLPEGTDLSDTAGVTCRVYSEEDITNITFRFVANETGGTMYFNLGGFKIRKGWNNIFVPWTKINTSAKAVDTNFHLDLDQIVSVQIGLNSSITDVPAFYVADFGVYKQPDSGINSKISEVYPAAGKEVNSSSVTVSALVSEEETGIKADSVRVLVDGAEIPAAYDSQSKKISTAAQPMDNGSHTLTIKYYDQVNRVVQISSDFTVSMSPEVMTEYLLDKVNGMSIDHGVKNSLTDKLENALASIKKGNKNSSANQLKAFKNEVNAQSGKKLTIEQAEELKAYAGKIIISLE